MNEEQDPELQDEHLSAIVKTLTRKMQNIIRKARNKIILIQCQMTSPNPK